MSQRNRRVLAALSLTAALLLALPMPARAMGLWEIPSVGLTARVWSWLEKLGIGGKGTETGRPAARWEKEGSAIDPDGRPHPGVPTPPASATSDAGITVDPDGRN
jgi:hypothetical protein